MTYIIFDRVTGDNSLETSSFLTTWDFSLKAFLLPLWILLDFFQGPVLDLSLLLLSLYSLSIESHIQPWHTHVYSDNSKGISEFNLAFESQSGLYNCLFNTSIDCLLDQFPRGLCPHLNSVYHTNSPNQLKIHSCHTFTLSTSMVFHCS